MHFYFRAWRFNIKVKTSCRQPSLVSKQDHYFSLRKISWILFLTLGKWSLDKWAVLRECKLSREALCQSSSKKGSLGEIAWAKWKREHSKSILRNNLLVAILQEQPAENWNISGTKISVFPNPPPFLQKSKEGVRLSFWKISTFSDILTLICTMCVVVLPKYMKACVPYQVLWLFELFCLPWNSSMTIRQN